MRVVVQRVKSAAVRVGGEEISRIPNGLLLLVGFTKADDEAVLQWMARKVTSLRVFEDADGKMNRDLEAISGHVLAVPQFTLYGDCRKGARPSFDKSAPPDVAEVLYDRFVEILQGGPNPVATGAFREHMEVDFVNDGPVTLIIEKDGE